MATLTLNATPGAAQQMNQVSRVMSINTNGTSVPPSASPAAPTAVGPTGGRSAGRNLILPQSDANLPNTQSVLAANQYPLPDSVTISVASAAGSGAAPVTVYLINEQANGLGNQVTDNGSGAGSVTYAYQDNFGGKLLSSLLRDARTGMGAICYGIAIRMNITSGGAGDPAGLATANPFFIIYNALGRSNSTDFNSTDGQNRSQYDDSIQVWNCIQNVGSFVQLGFTIPVADTATITLYFNPNVPA
jgi:hypothetical protein